MAGDETDLLLVNFFNWSIVVACFSKHAFVLHYTYVCIITLLSDSNKTWAPNSLKCCVPALLPSQQIQVGRC